MVRIALPEGAVALQSASSACFQPETTPILRYAITERSALPGHAAGAEAALAAQVAQWVEGGVEWVQVREKDLPLAALEALVRRLSTLTAASRTQLLVNGIAAERARQCGADGVHLPGGAAADAVRTAAGTIGAVSVSCHTLGDVAAAVDGGAALLVWAPVFAKPVSATRALPGSGLAALREACAAAGPTPVFALGGVTEENARACIEAGAAGVAGIRLFVGDSRRML